MSSRSIGSEHDHKGSTTQNLELFLGQIEHLYDYPHRLRKDVLAVVKEGKVNDWCLVLDTSNHGEKVLCLKAEHLVTSNRQTVAVAVDIVIPPSYPYHKPVYCLRRPDVLRLEGKTYAYISNADSVAAKENTFRWKRDGHGLTDGLYASAGHHVVEQQLHSAVRDGRMDVVQQLLDDGYDCNAVEDNQTPMQIAVELGQVDIARLLLTKGGKLWHELPSHRDQFMNALLLSFSQPVWQANVWLMRDIVSCTQGGLELLMNGAISLDSTTVITMLWEAGFTPKLYAPLSISMKTTTMLLSMEADVMSKDLKNDMLILELAVRFNDIDLLRVLIAAGADIHDLHRWSLTALHAANDVETAQLLLDAGTEVDARDSRGCTPLFYVSPKVKKLLLANGADVNARNNKGKTALIYHRQSWWDRWDRDYIIFGVEEVSSLIEAGTCLSLPNSAENLLHRVKHPDIAKLLVGNQNVATAALASADQFGRTPLHVHAVDSSTDILRLFLPMCTPAILNLKDNNGRTALHLAVSYLQPANVELLLQAGAGLDEEDNNGRTPLAKCVERFYPCTIPVAAEVLTMLLKAGANPNVRCPGGNTLLHIAIERGMKDAVQTLMTNPVKILINQRDTDGETVLHVAARKMPSLLPALLEAGAKIDAQDSSGLTTLHIAVGVSNAISVQQLLAAGADLALRDIWGRQPIDVPTTEQIRSMLQEAMQASLKAVATEQPLETRQSTTTAIRHRTTVTSYSSSSQHKSQGSKKTKMSFLPAIPTALPRDESEGTKKKQSTRSSRGTKGSI